MGRWLQARKNDPQTRGSRQRLSRWQRARQEETDKQSTPAVADQAPTSTAQTFAVGEGFEVLKPIDILKLGKGPIRRETAARVAAERATSVPASRKSADANGSGVGRFIASTLQAAPRAVTSFGLSVVSGPNAKEFQPTGRVAKTLLGDEPVKTPQQRIGEAGSLVSRIRGEDSPSLSSFVVGSLGVAASTILDTEFGGAAGKAGAKKAAEKILKEIAERTGQEATEEMAQAVAREVTEAYAKKGFAKKRAVEAVSTKYRVLASPPPSGPFDPESYVKELVTKQETARTGPVGSVIEKGRELYQTAKRKLIDFNAPIEDTLGTAERKGKFKVLPEKDIRAQIDRALRSPTLAGQFARDNGLERVIKEVDNLDNLDQYMIAKQAQAIEARGFKSGRDLVRDRQLIAAVGEKYEPFAGQVSEYSRKLLDYTTDAGLIGKETADNLKQIYPDYVPLNRIFTELEQAGQVGRGKAVASLSKQTVVQGLKGSEREIESPMVSILEKTNDAFVQGEKNKAAKILAGYKDLPDNPFGLRELGPEESARFTISYLENGKKRIFETTKEIAEAAKSLNVQQLNILGKILAFPVRLAKLGITGISAPFAAANIVKDQLFAAITSDNTLRTSVANPGVFLRSFFSALKHDELYEQLVRAGAGGTSFDIARGQAKPTISKLRAGRNVGTKALYLVRHPGELLRAVEDIFGRSEEFARLTQFSGTKQAALAKGMSVERATITAAKAARSNTANFYRRGEWGTVLNATLLYLNAGIQGSRALIQSLRRSPVKTSAKIGGMLLFPMATATTWNLAEEDRRKAYADIPEYEKENNFIIIPPNPTQDEKGRWNVIKIPLPPGVSNLTIPVRRTIEAAEGLDPVKFGEMASALIGSVSPISPDKGSIISTVTPQIIKPTLEAATNQNFFTGAPQVPFSMEKLSPELQARDNTSGTARIIARAIGGSPIKIEEFIKGSFGSVGAQTLNAVDQVLAGADIIPQDQIGGQNVVDAIGSRFLKARGGMIEDKNADLVKDALTTQADQRFLLKQAAETVYEELKALPAQEANTKARELYSANPTLYAEIQDVAESERLGLTYDERLIKQLGVENGARAKFIWAQIESMPNEGKNAYLKHLYEKKIVTKDIIAQIQYLATRQ